jgi:hypothetical protein
MEKEIWKDVPGYEGIYQVSNLGSVLSLNKNKKRKFGDNGHGYLFVSLSKDGAVKCFYVHRLVAKLFIDNPKNKATVNHKNGIKSDNRACNLEWMTQSENSQHGFDTGLIKQNTGIKNPCSVSVVKYSIDGDFIKKYDCISDAAKENALSPTNIGAACSGKYERAGMYQWRYASDNIKRLPFINRNKSNGEKPVEQIDIKTGRIVSVFASGTDASRVTGIYRGGISDACNMKIKTSGGYKWKFL